MGTDRPMQALERVCVQRARASLFGNMIIGFLGVSDRCGLAMNEQGSLRSIVVVSSRPWEVRIRGHLKSHLFLVQVLELGWPPISPSFCLSLGSNGQIDVCMHACMLATPWMHRVTPRQRVLGSQ